MKFTSRPTAVVLGLTLAAAASERIISHGRIMEMTGLHSVEASRLLQALVRGGYLESHNPGRGAVYCLPGAACPRRKMYSEVAPTICSSAPNICRIAPDICRTV